MEHELLHNDPGDLDLRLSNRPRKERDKNDIGERKKWNFRKTSSSDTSGNDGPSPSFGLINQPSETRSKKTLAPTMIFENALSDHDENDVTVKSPPTSLSVSPSAVQHTRTSPIAVDQQQASTRPRQKSLPSSTSPPPPVINRPHSGRKPGERILRQTSVPAVTTHQTTLPHGIQQRFTSTTQPERSDLQNNNNPQNVQPPFYPSENLSNVMEVPQENQLRRARMLSDKETVDDNIKVMWQGNQDKSQGDWTDFLSPSNEVFVPDDRAWAGAENVAIDAEDSENPRNISNSSRSSNSSESDNDNTEESVWRINDEQKAYYLNQFRILQPAEKGVVAGQKARDFFLKSGLGTDVLSKIWNLADLDSDGALNFVEFCIAMHIVVAVRHGLEVPAVLPHYLIPNETQVAGSNSTQMIETGHDEVSLRDSSQSWARFSPDPRTSNEISEADGQPIQQPGQHVQQIGQHSQAETALHQVQQQISCQPNASQEKPVPQPVSQPAQQVSQPPAQHRVERTLSEASSADENTAKSDPTPRKISVGIPRVRGQPKQTNLLDTPHWAILPPPSKFSKENPEEISKGNQFVPTGTIIPAYPEEHSKQVSPKLEKQDQTLIRDSDSSSCETEEGTKERQKSLMHENEDFDSSPSKNSSDDNSLAVDQDSVDGTRKLSAPVPPPRTRSGHSRSSSLDLQKLFNSKAITAASAQNASDSKESTQTRETQENFADFSKFDNTTVSHSNENIARFGHRRSASLDSTHAVFVEASSQLVAHENADAKDSSGVRHEVSASVPRPVPKKKPASPPPPLRTKKDGQQDSGSDTMMEKEKKVSKEPIRFVVKPLTRLEQLHAKIRDLKTKNTRLSRVNGELQQELKEMMKTRVGLESSLEQLKPFAK